MTPSTASTAVERTSSRASRSYKQEDVESFDDLDRSGTRPSGAKKASLSASLALTVGGREPEVGSRDAADGSAALSQWRLDAADGHRESAA